MELNDTGILVHHEGRVPAGYGPGPGIALVERGRISTGAGAAARARLLPKQVDDRVWSELDTRPIGPPFPVTPAEQLRERHRQRRVVLSQPFEEGPKLCHGPHGRRLGSGTREPPPPRPEAPPGGPAQLAGSQWIPLTRPTTSIVSTSPLSMASVMVSPVTK